MFWRIGSAAFFRGRSAATVYRVSVSRNRLRSAAVVLAVLAHGEQAFAGMPSSAVMLERLTTARLDTISFFLLVFLLSAWGLQRIWNGLSADFPVLPRLSYPRSVGLTTLWSLLFILVLTMISGARELMTPGAWEKNGVTYRLSESRGGGK